MLRATGFMLLGLCYGLRVLDYFFGGLAKRDARPPGYPLQVRPTHKSITLRAFRFYPWPMPARSFLLDHNLSISK
jgi:hypothetical protein